MLWTYKSLTRLGNFVSVRFLSGKDLKWMNQLTTTSALPKKPRKSQSLKLNMKITMFMKVKGWFNETIRYLSTHFSFAKIE